MTATDIGFIVAAYVLGSVPFGVVAARLKGVDIRKVGSGNVGATNVLRGAGKAAALFTLIGDALKGTLAVYLAMRFGLEGFALAGVALAAILGHNFSLFLGFHGGKGVATSLGVLLIYAPKAAILTIVLWLLVAATTRYSSLGALVSFALLPLGMYYMQYPIEKIVFSAIITGMLFIKHRDNIKRLLAGTESRIGHKGKGGQHRPGQEGA